MARHDIVVIGASAGGVEALRQLAADIPRELRAAVFVVLHTSPQGRSVLPQILNRVAHFPAVAASHEAEIVPGRMYVAPPDRHLLLDGGRMQLSREPVENRNRPAIDPLFISAANAYGPRVAGVILSGYLDDGVAGLAAVKRKGGVAIVQHPDDAIVPDMPRNALDYLEPDYVLPVRDVATVLSQLASEPAEEKIIAMAPNKQQSKPGVFSCPECNGVLWEIDDGKMLRFRCRVGHAFSQGSMYADQGEAVERALWAATRALEERAHLSERLAERSREQKRHTAEERYRERAEASKANAAIVRDLLLNGDFAGPAEVEDQRTGT